MTPTDLATKHIDAWFADDMTQENHVTLRQHFVAAIEEALALQREEYQRGATVLRHQLDAMRQARDDAVEAAHLIAEGLR